MLIETRSRRSARKWPKNISEQSLPTHVALLFKAFLEERNPRVELHWLLDTLEVMTRWLVAVLIAEIARANGGELPERLLNAVRGLIERPSFGQWVNILRSAVKRYPKGTFATVELKEFAKRDMLTCLEGDP